MDNTKIAKELLMLAKALVAGSIRVGDICRLDKWKALQGESGSSEYAKMVKQIWNRSSGWVEVLEVNGERAKITQRQYGSGPAKLITSVPLDSLDNTMKRFDTPKELGLALGLEESTVSQYLKKGDFPVMQDDMNWIYLKQEMKINREMFDNSDDRFRGPEL
jgi:hypothetical protein